MQEFAPGVYDVLVLPTALAGQNLPDYTVSKTDFAVLSDET